MDKSAHRSHASPAGRRRRGFESAGRLLSQTLKSPAEKRGFGDARLLTHWPDIVGADLAAIARPVKITYGKGFGGTLVLLTTGAQAPLVEMQKNRIIDRVNATYGYRAVARLHITQTAPTGFAEGRAAFTPAAPPPPPAPDPEKLARTDATLAGIESPELRQALTRLARNVLTPRQE
jgi:hypothetical protein